MTENDNGERKKTRLEELAGEDKTTERFVIYIGMAIAIILLIIILGMVLVSQ